MIAASAAVVNSLRLLLGGAPLVSRGHNAHKNSSNSRSQGPHPSRSAERAQPPAAVQAQNNSSKARTKGSLSKPPGIEVVLMSTHTYAHEANHLTHTNDIWFEMEAGFKHSKIDRSHISKETAITMNDYSSVLSVYKQEV